MNKNFFKFLILIVLILLLEGGFYIGLAKAGSGLVLKVVKECNIQYAGDDCVVELELTNNTDAILEGEACLHIDYQGICSNNELRNFDGEGISAQFFNNHWLDFTGWEDGITTVSGFSIAKNQTQPKLKINTASNLCPGEYAFVLTLKGISKTGEEYETRPSVIGGIGGASPLPPPLTIYNEAEETVATTSITIKWETNYYSTSQVIYGTMPNQFDFSVGPKKYGYAFATLENTDKVSVHSMVLTGLIPGTIYYYRCVSCASPAVISQNEYSFTTLAMALEEDIPILAPGPTPLGPGPAPESIPGPGLLTSPVPISGPGLAPSPTPLAPALPSAPKTEIGDVGFGANMMAAIGNIMDSKFLLGISLFLLIVLVILLLKEVKERYSRAKRKKQR